MKLLKITSFYEAYLKKFYRKHSYIKTKGYEEQKRELDYDAFGWSDFWLRSLTPLGYEVMEITTNIEPLQKSWAVENGIKFKEDTWLHQIAFAQINKFAPTVLFLENHSIFTSSWLKELKQTCPSICLIISWCGAPYEDKTLFRDHNLVLSCIPELVEQFQAMGHHSEHINHAFDPCVLEKINLQTQPNIDFSFVGQIVRESKYHLQRERLLENLVSQIPIQIYSPSTDVTWRDTLKVSTKMTLYDMTQILKAIGIPGNLLAKLPKVGKLLVQDNRPMHSVNPRLQLFMQPAVFGLEMFQTLRNSKSTLNNHIDISPRSASNMRLFEATGVGTCLVTDWKQNLNSLFELDREVVTYASVEECVEKVKWLLEHPQQRNAIAQAGQARTLKYHTFTQRAIQLDSIIQKELSRL